MLVEFALKIEDIASFNSTKLADYLTSDVIEKLNQHFTSRNKEKTRYSDIQYLYFGNEFCEHCIPHVEEVCKFVDLCKENSLQAVLVTPCVTDYGIQKLEVLVDAINERMATDYRNISIVVNDVGILNWLHKSFPQINLIIGRLFDQSNRESRVSKSELQNYYSDSGNLFAQTPGLFSDSTTQLLGNMSSHRLSLDVSKIGNNLYSSSWSIDMYWPYTYITTGRSCLWRNSLLLDTEKYVVDSTCDCLCRKKYALLTSKEKNVQIYQKGNTLFDKTSIDDLLSSIQENMRIIIQEL